VTPEEAGRVAADAATIPSMWVDGAVVEAVAMALRISALPRGVCEDCCQEIPEAEREFAVWCDDCGNYLCAQCAR
jgi:hypothetical protein